MKLLTKAQLVKARDIARNGDYEVRNLLDGYLYGDLDDEGINMLLEEIGE